MFPDLSELTWVSCQMNVHYAAFRKEAVEMVDLIGGKGWWPGRREREEVIYDMYAWIETVQWG